MIAAVVPPIFPHYRPKFRLAILAGSSILAARRINVPSEAPPERAASDREFHD